MCRKANSNETLHGAANLLKLDNNNWLIDFKSTDFRLLMKSE